MSPCSAHPASANAAAKTAMAPIGQFVFRTLLFLVFTYRKVIAPVLRPAAFVVLGAKRKLLAVADCRDSAAADSERHQVILGGLRALGAERHIVFLRSALIAMTLDLHLRLRILLQPARVGLQHRAVLILDRVIV